MAPGVPGLSKRKASADFNEESKTSIDSARSVGPRFGSLHAVDADRRMPTRMDLSMYPALEFRPPMPRALFKRLFDLFGALLLGLIFSPLVLAIVLISMLSGGTPLFRHRRVGRNGVFFDCLKFRTMVPNADQVLQNLLDSDRKIKEEWLMDHKLRDDPRVTRLGKFLRRTSLDELPQLWNVVRGDMSLVGPRPVVPDELRRFGTKIPTVLSGRPGITGLWQVSGRNDTDYRKRVALDVCYIRYQSFSLDVYILIKTIPAVFSFSGAY